MRSSSRGTIALPFLGEYHMLGLLDTRDGLHVGVHQLACHVHDAGGAEDVPIGVEGSGAGEAGGIGEGEGRFEAAAGDDGDDAAGVVQVDAFVAREL